MPSEGIVFAVHASNTPVTVTLTNAYNAGWSWTVTVPARGEREVAIETRSTGGWYDLRLTVQDNPFVREFAGHLENGRPSISDPAFGR
jgi:phospholipase C